MGQGQEVAAEVVRALANFAKGMNADPDVLFKDNPAWRARSSERLDWRHVAPMYDLVGSLAHSKAELHQLGKLIYDEPSLFHPLRALGIVLEPRRFLELGIKTGVPRFFSNIETRLAAQADKLRIEYRLRPGCRPSESFFHLQAGAISHMTIMLGLPPCEISVETDGRSAVYLVTLPPSKTLRSKITRSMWVLRNSESALSEMRLQQEALHKKNAELAGALENAKEAIRARDVFLSTISHELRTPLNGLVGGLDSLDKSQDPHQSQMLQLAVSAAEQLRNTIESIVDYNTSSAEGFEPSPRNLATADLIEGLKRRAEKALYSAKVSFRCDSMEALPERLNVDDERLLQIVMILINNIARHSGAQVASLRLRFQAPSSLVLTICDDGKGIAKERRNSIFLPFVQGDEGARRTNQGVGLGLSLARRLTDRLGGTLELLEGQAQGTAFKLVLPAKAVVPQRPDDLIERPHALIVDDERVNRKILGSILKRLNCTFDEAVNGEEAFRNAVAQPYDIIFMDCEMPVLDGWAATQKIKAHRGDSTFVVAVTAYTSEKDRRRCREARMNDFVAKPISRQRIADCLVEASRLKQAPQPQ